MPWKEVSAMSLRSEFLRLAQLPDANILQLAKRFGISRKTAYKWIARAARGQPPTDRSRKPASSPTRTADELEQLVLQVRTAHPAWGGRKIRAYLRNRPNPNPTIPAASTITEILRRHGQLLGPRAGQPRDWQRFEHDSPNNLWQMDFKGHFAMTDGQRCHALTILDDHSRYSIGLIACSNETTETVRAALIQMFTRYGMPARMLMDNGSPWGDEGGQPYTQLTVWLMRLGIRVSHGRPYHPQTQGKDERFHRSLKEEVLNRYTITDLADAQRRFDVWREVYNCERPHEALGLQPPASRYRCSPRDYPQELPALVYPSHYESRAVSEEGRISYCGKSYGLSKAFRGLRVGLESQVAGPIRIWFGGHLLGHLDETSGQVVRQRSPSVAAESAGGGSIPPL